MTTPDRIWIEEDENPYYYEESDRDEATSPVAEYVRADLCPAPDAVARLVEAANQARLAFAGYVSAQSANDKLDAASQRWRPAMSDQLDTAAINAEVAND